MYSRLGVAAFLLSVCSGSFIHAQQTVAEHWAKIYAANTIVNEESQPFHLVFSYQIYDLAGNATEKGTVEEWWASSKSRRIKISGPSFSDVKPTAEGNGPTAKDGGTSREKLLITMLRDAIVRPVPSSALRPQDKIVQKTEYFGQTALSCLVLDGLSSPTLDETCIDPNGDAVRVVRSLNGDQTIARNAIGKFHDTRVATKISIGLVGKTAATGEVTTLEVIDPAKHTDVLPAADKAATAPGSGAADSGHTDVKSGKRIGGEQPIYPPIAKVAHLSGSVIVHAVITKEGTIREPVVIAATNVLFVGAATEAVKQWKYQPYLVSGEPVEVDTSIAVNFNMSP